MEREHWANRPRRLFDALTRGVMPGSMIVLAGPPEAGKTALALSIAHRRSMRANLPCLILAAGLTEGQIAARMISMEGLVPLRHITATYVDDDEWMRVEEAASRLSMGTGSLRPRASSMLGVVEIDAEGGFPELERVVRADVRGRGTDLIILDDAQSLVAGSSGEARDANRRASVAAAPRINELSRQLKTLARALDIGVLAVWRLERRRGSGPYGRFELRDLPQHDEVDSFADAVMFLDRETLRNPDTGYPTSGEMAELNVAKNRHGAAGHISLYYDPRTASFHDVLDDLDPDAWTES